MDNAKKFFNTLIDQGYLGIQEMIGKEENLFLDFKEKKDTSKSGIDQEDKRNYVKALSGFSNSSGGVLVWGIKAKKLNADSPDVAIGEKPISNLKKFITDLNSLVSDAMQPLNSEIQNVPIYIPEQDDIGFVITYVPECDLLPVRALLGVNQYYSRIGDSFIMMEHYMLADMFGKRQKPKLEIFYSIQGGGGGQRRQLKIIFGIKNIGDRKSVV